MQAVIRAAQPQENAYDMTRARTVGKVALAQQMKMERQPRAILPTLSNGKTGRRGRRPIRSRRACVVTEQARCPPYGLFASADTYDPSRQRLMKSRRSGPRTFCATACLRQAR